MPQYTRLVVMQNTNNLSVWERYCLYEWLSDTLQYKGQKKVCFFLVTAWLGPHFLLQRQILTYLTSKYLVSLFDKKTIQQKFCVTSRLLQFYKTLSKKCVTWQATSRNNRTDKEKLKSNSESVTYSPNNTGLRVMEWIHDWTVQGHRWLYAVQFGAF